jgi:uncharacterized OB-fold protein
MNAERTPYLPAGLPVPQPDRDGLDQEYWDAAARHELVVQRCSACGALQWLPEWICYRCRSFDLAWERVSGRGRIFSWERVWHPVHPALRDAVPYLVVVVELEEDPGLRMTGNLLGEPRQDVRPGTPVEAVFEEHPEGFTLVQWAVRRSANPVSGTPVPPL